MSAEQKKAVLDYVLVELCEISDETMKKLGITLSLRKIMSSDDKVWENLCERKVLSVFDIQMITKFKKWYMNQRSEGVTFPDDVEDWKKLITPDILDDYIVSQVSHSVTSETPIKNITPKMDNLAVKIADFPDFNGKMENWRVFKQKFEAIAALSNFTELLQVKNTNAHIERRQQDSEYDFRCKVLQQILRKITAGGTALSKVLMHSNTEDGVLSWYDMKNYYDQEGDKMGYGARLIGQLADLKLEYDTHGGMDKYVSEFENINIELDSISPLDDTIKKTFFLRGIHDDDYAVKKDLCSEFDFRKTVLEMRNKAAELGKTSGPASKQQRKQNKKTSRSKHKKESNDSDIEEDSDFEKGSYFDEELWDQMSPANRKYIMELKKKYKNYFKEEGNNVPVEEKGENKEEKKARNINMVNASNTTEPDTPPTAPGEIWKPGLINKKLTGK